MQNVRNESVRFGHDHKAIAWPRHFIGYCMNWYDAMVSYCRKKALMITIDNAPACKCGSLRTANSDLLDSQCNSPFSSSPIIPLRFEVFVLFRKQMSVKR